MSFIPTESIENAEKIKQADKEYEAINLQYQDQKFVAEKKAENLAKSPYGEYKPEKEEKDLEESEVLLTEGVKTPFITMFIKEGFLTPDEGRAVQEALLIDGDIEKLRLMDSSLLPEEKKEQLIGALGFIDDKRNQQNFQDNFEVDMGAELGYEKMNDSQQFVFNQIGAHYILPLDGEIDDKIRKIALDTAIEAALNEIIDTPIFKKTNAYYDVASIIRNDGETPRKRFEKLEQVSKNIGGHNAFKGKKRETTHMQSQKRTAQENAGLKEQYEQALINLSVAEKTKNTKAMLTAQAQIEELDGTTSLGDLGKKWDTEMEVGGTEGGNGEDSKKAA